MRVDLSRHALAYFSVGELEQMFLESDKVTVDCNIQSVIYHDLPLTQNFKGHRFGLAQRLIDEAFAAVTQRTLVSMPWCDSSLCLCRLRAHFGFDVSCLPH